MDAINKMIEKHSNLHSVYDTDYKIVLCISSNIYPFNHCFYCGSELGCDGSCCCCCCFFFKRFSVSANTRMLMGTFPQPLSSCWPIWVGLFAKLSGRFSGCRNCTGASKFSGQRPPCSLRCCAASLRFAFQNFKSSLNNSQTQFTHPLMQQLSGSRGFEGTKTPATFLGSFLTILLEDLGGSPFILPPKMRLILS